MVLKFFANLSEEHEKLKKRIHSFRIPLSPTGQRIMGFVYFSIPIIIGYFIMDSANSQAKHNLENLSRKSRSHEVTKQNEYLQNVLDGVKEEK